MQLKTPYLQNVVSNRADVSFALQSLKRLCMRSCLCSSGPLQTAWNVRSVLQIICKVGFLPPQVVLGAKLDIRANNCYFDCDQDSQRSHDEAEAKDIIEEALQTEKGL